MLAHQYWREKRKQRVNVVGGSLARRPEAGGSAGDVATGVLVEPTAQVTGGPALQADTGSGQHVAAGDHFFLPREKWLVRASGLEPETSTV